MTFSLAVFPRLHLCSFSTGVCRCLCGDSAGGVCSTRNSSDFRPFFLDMASVAPASSSVTAATRAAGGSSSHASGHPLGREAETTFSADQQQPSRQANPRARSRRGRPSETQPVLERRRHARGALVLEPSNSVDSHDNHARPRVRVAFAEGSEHRIGDDDGVRLLKATPLNGTAADWIDNHSVVLTDRSKKVTPSELLGKSLIAGRQALLAHFALLAYHQCSIVDLEVIDTLLSRGADVNAVDTLGQTALHEVARLWDAHVASHLISKGARLDHADHYGRQPIHVASGEDSVEIVKLLVEHGVDVNFRTSGYLQSPVHHAASNDAVKALAFLIEHGAEYEDCDYAGRTPLQLAVELDRTEAVRYLLTLKRPAFSGVMSTDGRKALTAMVSKMPEVAAVALSQFHSTSASQRSQLFWLNYLEDAPISKQEAIDSSSPRLRCKALSPLEVIVEGKHYNLLTTPVVLRSLKTKWNYFGRRHALRQTLIYLLSVLVWTVVAVSVSWEFRYKYPGSQVWRIVLEVIAVLFLIYDFSLEIVEYFRSRKQHEQWALWRLSALQRDLKECHPACPDEAEYIKQEIENVSESSSAYFEDLWNLLDWLCYLLMFASVVSHVIDIAQHSRTIARVHAAIIVATIIFMWTRLLKYLRAFRKLGPFVVMVTRIVRDVGKFFFLYLLFFVPYACGFWVFFGDRQVVTDTTTNATVTGFTDESDLIFQLFLGSIGSGDFISNIVQMDAVIGRLLVGTYLAVTSILLLNLLIALMSDTFQRVHDNVNQNSLMQQAATVVYVEKNLSAADRQKFREYIAKKCSPERVYYDDDDADQEDLQKIARRTYDEVLELKDYLTERLDNQDNELKTEVTALRQEVSELSAKVDSLLALQSRSKQPRQQQNLLTSSTPADGFAQAGGRAGSLPPLQPRPRVQ